jgi:hypothetical protein
MMKMTRRDAVVLLLEHLLLAGVARLHQLALEFANFVVV